MKLYLAHNFSAREWLPTVVAQLEEMGHKVTATWIWDDSHTNGGTKLDSALVDLEDIVRADVLVFFVDQYGPTPGQGKYFELGYAYAEGKRIILVGEEDRCVFYSLPTIERVKNIPELLKLIQKEKMNA